MFRDEKVGIKMPINGLKTQIVVANACVCEKKVVILQAKLKKRNSMDSNKLITFQEE